MWDGGLKIKASNHTKNLHLVAFLWLTFLSSRLHHGNGHFITAPNFLILYQEIAWGPKSFGEEEGGATNLFFPG